MTISRSKTTWERGRHILLWIALPLLVGVLCAAAIPRPVVGVIYLSDAIQAYSARDMITQIIYAREHPKVRAVVLVIDSPGGTVADTEAVYLEIQKLRQDKPVVASIGSMAASGAYYLSVAADYIYAKPTSEVGNVGVIGYLPSRPAIYESIISTGPYKLFGAPRDDFMREMEMIKQGFFQAVSLGRGDRLQISPQVLLTGRLWTGSEGIGLGLVDGLGSESDAFEKAAEMARIGNYKVADLYDLAGLSEESSYQFFYQSPEGVRLPYPNEPGIYLLYVPPVPVEK